MVPRMFAQALCRGVDFFFDPNREADAKALCIQCQCKMDCLSLSTPDDPGVWGGLTQEERNMQAQGEELREVLYVGGRKVTVEWN